jgi:site-specific recombinase XerC
VKTRHAGLRRFCHWLVEEGEIEVNPVMGIGPSMIQESRSQCSTVGPPR